MTKEEAFEAYLDRDNRYGVFECLRSALACEDRLNEWALQSAINDMRETFYAGWDAREAAALQEQGT